MHDNTKAIGFETIYVKIDDFLNGRCPFCGSNVEELYPSSGHSFSTLDGWVNMVVYWYECTNPSCTNPTMKGRFKAPQPYVLPYKKFGQDVWVFVIQEWERFRTNPGQISARLTYKGVIISEEKIQEMIDEYEVLKHEMVNEETMEIIKNQGIMIIGCDGTPTEGGRESLWTFYDVISGRILYATLLASADHEALLQIFKMIEARYGVDVVGFLSDHQTSIKLACEAFNPDLPHQTCHFHFLRNHWDFIEKKDTHLNKLLQKVVNSLPIMINEYNGGAIYSQGIRVKKKSFFKPLIKMLKKAVNHQTEEFDKLKGIKAFEDISTILECLDAELPSMDETMRPVIQLQASRDKLHEVLFSTKKLYKEVQELDATFQSIRLILGDKKKEKAELKRQLRSIYGHLWNEHKRSAGYGRLDELKSVLPRFSLKNSAVFCQWRRLWDSHEPELFHYLDVEGMERTNIYNEKIYSQLKRESRKTSGKSHGMYMVFTRGEHRIADICSKNTFTIHEVLSRYDVKHLRVLKAPLEARKQEALSWHASASIDRESLATLCEAIRQREWETA